MPVPLRVHEGVLKCGLGKTPLRGKPVVHLHWPPSFAGAGSALAVALSFKPLFPCLRKVLFSLYRLEWSLILCLLFFNLLHKVELLEDTLLYEPPGSCLLFLWG